MDKSSRVFKVTFGATPMVPPRCIKKVRSLMTFTTAPSMASTATWSCAACWSSDALQVRSTIILPSMGSEMSRAVTRPPASLTALETLAMADALSSATRMVTE